MKRYQVLLWMAAASALVAAGAAGCDDFNRMMSSQSTSQAPTDGEGYTILLCPPYEGTECVRLASEAKEKTTSATGWKDVYVVHEDRFSCLYRGRYSTEEEAGKAVKEVRVWKSSLQTVPFSMAIVVPRAIKRVGPPEWSILNCRDPNFYTVVIGEFHNVPEENFNEREQKAVENCRALRERGEEAYYYHGPAKSYVMVGLFPGTAFRSEQDSGGVRAVIQSEQLRKVLKGHPRYAVNGYEAYRADRDPVTNLPKKDPKTGAEVRLYDTSYVTSLSEYLLGKGTAGTAAPRQPQPR